MNNTDISKRSKNCELCILVLSAWHTAFGGLICLFAFYLIWFVFVCMFLHLVCWLVVFAFVLFSGGCICFSGTEELNPGSYTY